MRSYLVDLMDMTYARFANMFYGIGVFEDSRKGFFIDNYT